MTPVDTLPRVAHNCNLAVSWGVDTSYARFSKPPDAIENELRVLERRVSFLARFERLLMAFRGGKQHTHGRSPQSKR